MKLIFSLLLLCSLFLINVTPLFAAEPVPIPTPQIQQTNEFTTDNDPNSIITVLKGFIQGFDTFMGGFIFYTPNPLSDKITLKDNSEIPGITKYRTMFYQIAIPLLAIIISAIAITKIGSDNAQELKSFGLRLLITLVLFITVPQVLSYSIQATNLLNNTIMQNQQLTGFINDYLDQSQTAINQGNNSEQYGIPQFHYSLIGGVLKFLGEFIVKLFLFALTFVFLLLGFLYIGFQFVIRFASLLFLGVIYPIIIPFMLSERTQHIVYTYFKSWFTFLIMQPAFVLGFAIATDIFGSILNAKGPSVGMLFFYTGFLFFLGGITTLVGRIFGSGFDSLATGMQASMASRSVMRPIQSNIKDFRRGAIGGTVSSWMGNKTNEKIKSFMNRNNENSLVDGGGSSQHKKHNGDSVYKANGHSNGFYSEPSIPQFSNDLNKKGLQVDMVNQKQGIVSVSGEAYQYNDPKTGLTSIYPTQLEAYQDGAPEAKLEKVNLDNAQFIDLSTFDKHNLNPHNFNAMEESKAQGKKLNHAFVNAYSHPDRIKNFLEVSKSRNEALGIKGVIAKRQGTQTSDHSIRLYTPHENRKNI